MSHPNQIKQISDIKQFVFGGNSYFTLKNTIADSHLTYHVSSPKNNRGKNIPYFVRVLSGGDDQYTYLGQFWNNDGKLSYAIGKKSRVSKDAPSQKTIVWLLMHFLNNKNLPDTVQFWHEGKCCRCARKLTNPESIELGIGPECRKRS